MKIIYYFLLFSFSILAMEHPITINLKKDTKDKYSLNVSAPKGFAIQKDAPNKIKFSSKDKLNVDKKEVGLNGKTFLDKPEYFETVDSIPLKITGKGKLNLAAKIFYCDLNKNVCYPANIKQEESIK